MATHKELNVWKESIDFVTEIYKITSNYPKSEIYGIVSQMRRSAVSIPSNIAEGAGRDSNKEYVRFLSVALGSVSELETQLIISENLGYIEKSEKRDEKIKSIRIKIIKLKKYLRGLE